MKALTAIALSASALTLAAGAAADPIDGTYIDVDECDDHGPQIAVEEFGDPTVFQPSQWIEHASTVTDFSACSMTDDPSQLNALVVMSNLTNRALDNLWYVGDPETRFSNTDGLGFGGGTPDVAGFAFRIDAIGANRPLVFESITPDGIFEPGETWQFIVQDYSNPFGLAPDAFFSVGMAGDSAGAAGVQTSSASIVRMVPTPGSAALLGLGGLAAVRRRR